MSTCFYWKVEDKEMPKAKVKLASGNVLIFDPQELVREENPEIHIGKRSSDTFWWAQDPTKTLNTCDENPDKKLVVNEYGREFTGSEFKEILSELGGNKDLIGVEFS